MKNMKKTYWWRVILLVVSFFIIGYWYLAVSIDELGYYNHYTKPLLFTSISFLLVTPFLFFVRDEAFKKWLWFALVWFGISVFFIALAPAYNHGLFSMMNPTKESVSLWMSVIFIPVSLGFLLWNSKHSKA